MRYRILIMLLLATVTVFAQRDIPERPSPPRLVNDLTQSTLSGNEISRLERKLLNYEDSTSTQVAIVIVNSLNGYEVVDFAQRTGEKWGVGQSNKDNGVLILVAIRDRGLAIVTGYGMEGSIPDAATFTIREDYMNPNFRDGDFYKGLDEGTDVIMKLASGEFKADQIGRRRSSGDGESKGFPFGFLFIIFFFVIPAIFGKRRGRNSVGSRSFPWWIFLLGNGSHRGGSNWNDFRGGGGGFGGGGGGFGGFGGGSFGGGGSGGSW